MYKILILEDDSALAGVEIWQGKLKKVENLEFPLKDVEYGKKT